jgi:aminobenzoyl-glutamate utilization protein B
MAATALDVIRDRELVDAAKSDHRARLAGTPFVHPIPPDVEPPVKEPARSAR